ncbi:MAG TPA: NADPH-dependent FMN reductase [Solirubrobacteraceae bacterium]
MRLLGLSGSLRRDSHNTRLLRAAAAKLPPGAELVVWPELAAIPPFSEDDEAGAVPPAVARLRHAVAGAHGVLVSTPEYNGSIPGQLKNALDWLSRPWETNVLRDRPVAAVGASTGLFGAVWAQADLRRVLETIGASVIDAELPVGQAHEAFTLRGDLRDPGADAALAELVDELVRRSGERVVPQLRAA